MPLRQQKYKKHIPGFSQKRVRFTHLQKSVHCIHFKNSNPITGDRYLDKIAQLAQLA